MGKVEKEKLRHRQLAPSNHVCPIHDTNHARIEELVDHPPLFSPTGINYQNQSFHCTSRVSNFKR